MINILSPMLFARNFLKELVKKKVLNPTDQAEAEKIITQLNESTSFENLTDAHVHEIAFQEATSWKRAQKDSPSEFTFSGHSINYFAHELECRIIFQENLRALAEGGNK